MPRGGFRLISAVLFLLFLLSLAGPSLAEWGVARGGPTRTGRSESRPFVRANALEVGAESGLGGDHLGSPVVAEIGGHKVIFAGSRDNRLYAVNPDGSVKWTYQTGGAVYSTPAVGDANGDGKLEVIFSSLDGWLYTVGAENGALVWKFNIGKASQAAPLIYDINGDGENEVVFNLGYPSTVYELRPYVYALRGDDGAVLWTVSIDGNVFSAPSAADVDGDGRVEVVFGSVNGRVYVVSGENGGIKWSRQVGRVYSTVPIADLNSDGQLDLIVCTWDNGVHALRASDGQPLWWVSSIPYVQTDPAVGDVDGDGVPEVFVASRNGRLYCLRGSDGSILWSFGTTNEILSSPTLADIDGDGVLDVLFGTDSASIERREGDNARVYALSGKSGSLIWMYERPGNIRSEIVVADLDYNGWPEILATGYLDSRVTVFRTVTVLLEERPEELENVIPGWRENTVMSMSENWVLFRGQEVRLIQVGGYWENTGQATTFSGGYGEAVVGTDRHLYIARCYAVGHPVYFVRYNPENRWFEELARPPDGTFRSGTVLAWDNGDNIYALAGGRGDDNRYEFWCYSISRNEWKRLADTPYVNPVGSYDNYAGQGAGNALTWVPGWVLGVHDDNYLYAFLGKQARPGGYYRGHASIFARYSIKNDSWEVLPFVPGWDNQTDDGASLVWAGGRYLYALQGEYRETVPNGNFARFDLLENRWENLPSLLDLETGGVGDGASLLWTGEEDYIYAAGGGSCFEEHSDNFYRFNIRENRWERLPNLPWRIDFYVGPRLAYVGSRVAGSPGRILFWAGNPSGAGSGEIWEYRPRFALSGTYVSRAFDLGAAVSWDRLTLEAETPSVLLGDATPASDEPLTLVDGSARTGASRDFGLHRVKDGAYEVVGEDSLAAGRLVTENWQRMADWPGLTNQNIVACYAENRLSGKGYIYAFDTRNLYRYDILENRWENLGTNPGSTTTAGAAMIWTGGDNIYMSRGGSGSPNFWRYSISENRWTALSDIPTTQLAGSSLAWGGGDNIYGVFRGTDNGLYVYSISSNTWTKLFSMPQGSTPPGPASGSSLVALGGYLYYAVGGSPAYWRYRISDNTWEALASAPASWDPGGAQEVVNEDYIYSVRGDKTTSFYRFSVHENRWETMVSLPAGVSNANDRLTFDGTYLYMLRAYGDSSFWRYRPITKPSYSLRWQQTIPITDVLEPEDYTYAQPPSFRLLSGGVTSLENVKFADNLAALFSERRYIDVYQTRSTTTENTTSTSFTDLPGASLSLSVPDNSYLLINFHAAHNSSVSGDKVEFRIMVGTYVVAYGYSEMAVASQDTTISLTRAWRVPAGNWTVKAQWRRSSGSGTAWCWERALTVWVVPENALPILTAREWSTVDTSSTDFEDLSGMSLQISVSENSYLFTNFHAAFDHSASGGKVEFRFMAGDTEIARSYGMTTAAGQDLMTSMTRAYLVTPGTYTVRVQWRVVTTGTASCWERSLNVVAIPARALSVWDTRDTSTSSTSGSSWTTLTSLSISPARPSTLAIQFHGSFNVNASGNKPEFQVRVDGSTVAMGYGYMGTASQDTTMRLVAMVPVSPGDHTVDVQWRVATGGGTAYCWEKSLNVVALENLYDMSVLSSVLNIPKADSYSLQMRYRLMNDNDRFVVYVRSPEPLPSDNTVALWRFDEGGGLLVRDSSPNGLTGFIRSAGPRWTAGRFGQAIRFENTGIPQFVEVPYSPSLAAKENFFVELWVKPERNYPDGSPSNRWYIFVRQDTPEGDEAWVIGYQTWDNALEFKVRNTEGEGFSAKYPTSLEAGKWYHVAGVKDGKMLKLYLDGRLVAMSSFSGSPASAGKLYISWREIQPRVDTFNGVIDEVRIENRVPDGTENILLYNDSGFPLTPYIYTWSEYGDATYDANSMDVVPPEGTRSFRMSTNTSGWAGWGIFHEITVENAEDSSGLGNHGVAHNVTENIGKIGTGLGFNGTNAYVSVESNASLNPTRVTVEAWAYFVEPPPSGSRQVIVSKFYGASWNSRGYELYMENTGTAFNIVFAVGPGQLEWGSFAVYSTTFVPGWHHLVGTFDGTNLRLYYDGSLVATEPWTGDIGSSDVPLCVGRKADVAGGYFKGIIDEVRVENRAISSEEVSYRYNNGAGRYLEANENTVLLFHFTYQHLDLSNTSALKFWVKTPANLKVEIEAPRGITQTKYISDYGWDGTENWQEITIPASVWSNLNNVYSPFKITIETGGTFYVDHIVWLPFDNAVSNEIAQDYQSDQELDPTSKTVGLWHMNEGEGDLVADSSVNGNNGSLSGGGVLWSGVSRYGYSLSFTGSSGFVSVPHSTILAPSGGLSQLTVSAWIRPRQVSATHNTIVVKRSYVWEPTNGWQLYIEPASDPDKAKLCAILKSAGGGYYGVAIDNAVPLNQWTHVALTYDGSTGTIRVYVNGVDRTSEDVWNQRGGGGNVVSAPDNLFIGCIGGTAEWFIGEIDDVRVENRVLSPSEIAAEAGSDPVWRELARLSGTGWTDLTRVLPDGAVENGSVEIRIADENPFSKSPSGIYIDYLRVASYRRWESVSLNIYGHSGGDGERIQVFMWNGVGWDLVGVLPSGSPDWLTVPISPLYVHSSGVHILYRSEDENDESPTYAYLDFVGIGRQSLHSTSVEAYVLLSNDGENWQEYGPFTKFPADLSGLPPSRFIRYRLRLLSDIENMTPVVRNVGIRAAAYTQDENIAWGGVRFDSFDEQHFSPMGIVLRRADGSRANAVLAGENITLRLRTFRGDLSSVKLRIVKPSGEENVSMSRVPSGIYDFWAAVINMPANENWSYFFELRDGDTVGYYADDPAKDCGLGTKYDSESQARLNAFRVHAQPLPTDPQGMVIYEVMVDRFYDGDPANNYPPLYDSRRENGNWKYYWGGDLRGLIQKLDYIAGMGISAIWITPVVNNIDVASELDNSTGYHGYWAKDFKQIENRFGTWDDFRELISEARKRNIRIILDWAPNHTSPAYYGENGALYDNGTFWTDYMRDAFTDVFWARESTTVSTTSTTFVDLSGMSLDIRIGENSYLLINFHAAFNSSVSGDKAEFQVLVDGTTVAVGYSQMGMASQDTTVSLTRAYFVNPGTYTVKSQWRRASGSGTLYCWERSLSVAVVPASWTVRDNRATDAVSTSSTAWVDLPGMISTLTVTENSYLLINFHVANNSTVAGDKPQFRIMVDGTEVAISLSHMAIASQDTTLSLTRAYPVTPGTYTVKAQWRRGAGSGTVWVWERSLNVVAIPARVLSVWDNRGTSTVSTTSSTWVSLPDNASLSVSVPENVVLLINFHANFNNTASGAKPQFMVRVGGVPVAVGYSRMAIASQDTNFKLVAAVPVGPGTHTVDVQWRIESGGGTAYCWERSLNVTAVRRNFNEFTWSWENVFRHNGDMDIANQDDRWNIRYRNLLQLADLNQLNPMVDNYLKEALKLFLDAGIGGLRIDAAKHMDPAWLKTLADYVYSGWENVYIMHESVVGFWDETYWDICQFDNNYGMHMINTALAFIIRDVFGWKSKNMYDLDAAIRRQFSFPVSDILWNQKVVNAVALHDWPRFRSMNKSTRDSELAIGLVLTIPGIPLVYYGEEQYMYNDNVNERGEIGGDPYCRGMMASFDTSTTYYRVVRRLAELRRLNPALRYGIISTVYVGEKVYVFERKFFNDVVLVAINLDSANDITLTNLGVTLPDDNYPDYLENLLGNGQTITVSGGVISSLTLPKSSMGVWYCLTENNDPWLGAIDPVMGRAGNKVRVSGKGFGNSPGQVVFDNGTHQINAQILEWADDHVYFKVPSGVGVPLGRQHIDVYVRTASGKDSNRILFQYLTDRLVLVVHRLDNTDGTELGTEPGQFLFVTGSVPEYSNWSARSENAVGPMMCPSWDNWFIVTAVPRSTYIEFKFIKARLGEEGTWESGPNHTFTSPENGVLYRRSRPGGGGVGLSLPPSDSGGSSGYLELVQPPAENAPGGENAPVADNAENTPPTSGENAQKPSPTITIQTSGSDLLQWSLSEPLENVAYEVVIDDDPSLSSPLVVYTTGENFLDVLLLGLPAGTYYWRVRARLPDNTWVESEVGSFRISRRGGDAGRPWAVYWVIPLVGLPLLACALVLFRKSPNGRFIRYRLRRVR